MIEITLLALLSIAALLAVNCAFGSLSGDVFADQTKERRSAVVWAITLFVGLVVLLFVNATTIAMMLFLTQQAAFNGLSGALKLAVIMVGYLGAAFAAARGLRWSLERRIHAMRTREQ